MAYGSRMRHTCYLPRVRAGTGVDQSINQSISDSQVITLLPQCLSDCEAQLRLMSIMLKLVQRQLEGSQSTGWGCLRKQVLETVAWPCVEHVAVQAVQLLHSDCLFKRFVHANTKYNQTQMTQAACKGEALIDRPGCSTQYIR